MKGIEYESVSTKMLPNFSFKGREIKPISCAARSSPSKTAVLVSKIDSNNTSSNENSTTITSPNIQHVHSHIQRSVQPDNTCIKVESQMKPSNQDSSQSPHLLHSSTLTSQIAPPVASTTHFPFVPIKPDPNPVPQVTSDPVPDIQKTTLNTFDYTIKQEESNDTVAPSVNEKKRPRESAEALESKMNKRAKLLTQMDAYQCLNPSLTTPFVDFDDVFCRLAPFHLMDTITDDENVNAGYSDAEFEECAIQAWHKSTNLYRLFQNKSEFLLSDRKAKYLPAVPREELALIQRLLVHEDQLNLNQEKELFKQSALYKQTLGKTQTQPAPKNPQNQPTSAPLVTQLPQFNPKKPTMAPTNSLLSPSRNPTFPVRNSVSNFDQKLPQYPATRAPMPPMPGATLARSPSPRPITTTPGLSSYPVTKPINSFNDQKNMIGRMGPILTPCKVNVDIEEEVNILDDLV